MGVNLNADGDYLSRATGLGATGIIDWTMWGWHRRTSGVGYAAASDANIFGNEGNAGRAMGLQFDNTFGAGDETGPLLGLADTSTGNTDFGANPSFDVWTFFVISVQGPAGAAIMEGEYSTDGNTWVTATRNPAGTEDSIVPASIAIGAIITTDAQASQGDYAYCGARAEYMNSAARRLLIYRSAFASGDWGYWRLADNTDLADTSGNGRTLTANGTVTNAGSDPTIPTLVSSATRIEFLGSFGRSRRYPL